MNASIGEMAGKVWAELSQNGSTTLAKLKTKLAADAFLLNAAIGWLAREGKIEVVKSANTLKISLKD